MLANYRVRSIRLLFQSTLLTVTIAFSLSLLGGISAQAQSPTPSPTPVIPFYRATLPNPSFFTTDSYLTFSWGQPLPLDQSDSPFLFPSSTWFSSDVSTGLTALPSSSLILSGGHRNEPNIGGDRALLLQYSPSGVLDTLQQAVQTQNFYGHDIGARVVDSAIAPNGDIVSIGYYGGELDLFGQMEKSDTRAGFMLRTSATGQKKSLVKFPVAEGGAIFPADIEIEPKSGAIAVAFNLAGKGAIGSIPFDTGSRSYFDRSIRWITKYLLFDSSSNPVREIPSSDPIQADQNFLVCPGDCMTFADSNSILLLRSAVDWQYDYASPRPLNDVRLEKRDLNGNLLSEFYLGATDAIARSTSLTTDASGNIYLSGLIKGKVGTKKVNPTEFIDGGTASEFLIGLSSSLKIRWKKLMPWNQGAPASNYPTSRVQFDRLNNVVLFSVAYSGRRDLNPDSGVDMNGADDLVANYLSVYTSSGNYLYSTPISVFSLGPWGSDDFTNVQKMMPYGGRYLGVGYYDRLTRMENIAPANRSNLPDLAITGLMMVERNNPNKVLTSRNVATKNVPYVISVVVSNLGSVSSPAAILRVFRARTLLADKVNVPIIKANGTTSVVLPVDLMSSYDPLVISVQPALATEEAVKVNNEISFPF